MAKAKKKQLASKPISSDAVIYVRVSSKEQEEEGFSIPAQLQAANEYARSHGLKVVQEFEDVESAKATGRQEFKKMLAFLRKSKTCRILIVEKTDRLYRNLRDWVDLDQLMNECDLAVHLYKEGTILTKDARSHEKFIHGIKVLMAKNYSDNLSEEVRKGMLEKARQGYYPSRPPVGYVNNLATKRIDLDPVRAPIIKRLFELYAAGGYSLSDIRKKAKEDGLTYSTDNATPLARGCIHRMLSNPIYYGDFLWKGKLYPGKHTPIISKELFDKVQALLTERGPGLYQEREFAFTGLITCGLCGCKVTAELKKERYTYYHCTGFKGGCENKRKNIREEVIEEKLGRIISGLKMDDRVFESLREALKSSHEDEREYHERAMAMLQGQETKLLNRLRQLYVDKLDGGLDDEMYKQLKADWDKELDDVRVKLRAHEAANQQYLEFGMRTLELAQTAYSSFSRRSAQEKRKLLDYVLSNCTLMDGELIPTYRQPFDLIASAADLTKKRERLDLTDPAFLEFRRA